MYPYTKFGFNLWRLREARGKSAKDMSQYLNIPAREYQGFEMGKKLPSDDVLLEISRLLKEEISTLKHWALFSNAKTAKGKNDESIHPLLGRLEENIEKLKTEYKAHTNQSLSKSQNESLEKLKSSITKVTSLPVLPMNFILISDALNSIEGQGYTYLHEFKNFITKDENLASFVSRDFYFGPYIFYAANLLYFAKKPFQSIQECLNHLTLTQFKELFTLATIKNGIYEMAPDIPRLQEHADFSSLACIFARELHKELAVNPPKEINFDYVYQACLLQGVGQYILFEKLKPSLKETGQEILKDVDSSNDIFLGIDVPFFKKILWSLHPTVSAIMAANWSFPKEVLEILMTHHDHPVSQVSANCALLKIINFFVDKDFPKLSKDDLKDLLKAYSQVNLPPEALYEVCVRMTHIKNALYERSSTLIEENQIYLSQVSQNANLQKKSPHIVEEDDLESPLHRSDFRFDTSFQDVLKNVAHKRFEEQILKFLSPQKGEPLTKVGDRVINFNLKLRYSLVKNINDVAEEFKMSKEEVRIRLELS